MLLQHESECQPSLTVPRLLLVIVMLQVRQFSSADGKGLSIQPKSATGSLDGPDQIHSFSLSISFPAVQNSNRVLRGFVRLMKEIKLSASDSLWIEINREFVASHIFLASIQPIRSSETL